LAQEYTQGLSIWKHRVIRQAVLEEQDQVDLVALGKAKRKIQQIVDAGRQRKRQSSRSRIARWDTAGKPTRQGAAGSAIGDNVPSAATGDSALDVPASAFPEIPGINEGEWEIGYAPLRHPDALALDERQVQDEK
jgi:hypothetical protein